MNKTKTHTPNHPTLPTLLLLTLIPLTTQPLQAQFKLHQHPDKIHITLDNQPIATYTWNDPKTTRPYLKNIHTPDGTPITRPHPPQPHHLPDHPTYHPGIWWAFGDIHGNDYWRLKTPIIGGNIILGPTSGQNHATFTVKNNLLQTNTKKTFLQQICHYTLLRRQHGILLITESTFLPKKTPYWLGDQEEMGLAIRLHPNLTPLRNPNAQILNANQNTNLHTIRTTPSNWLHYHAPHNNRHTGILLMNDPKNFRPPWWHAVNTGLLVANPLGENELNGRGKKPHNHQIQPGQTFRLRYGIYIHSHPKQNPPNPKTIYQNFLKTIQTIQSPNTHTNPSEQPPKN